MGGFFGITSKKECLLDVFFGTDYHSHLAANSGGIVAYDKEKGLQREIHNIQNTPFRTKFEHVLDEMTGTSALGSINDTDPQPLLIRSNTGTYAIAMVGIINNKEELVKKYLTESGGHFSVMTGGDVNCTELLAILINQKRDFVKGIKFAQDVIDGTATIIILKDNGNIIAARDKCGKLPVTIGKNKYGHAVSFESFAYEKLNFNDLEELGPGEIVEISPEEMKVLSPARKKKCVCTFLWSYYGYPNSTYEDINVEKMRYKNGQILALNDAEKYKDTPIDYVGGVPDSGTPHAIGYSNKSGKHFARAFIKYTPTWARSFTPTNQRERNKVAKMKQIPVKQLIKGKHLLFVDDSIVRGTQLRETVEFLYDSGAKSVHMRSACPPIMYGCKFLNFSRQTSDMDLITRRVIMELEGEEGFKHIDEYSDGTTERGKKMRKTICDKFKFDSLEFQSLEGLIKAVGLDKDELCTYCWDGKE